jgi:hypothetical protein
MAPDSSITVHPQARPGVDDNENQMAGIIAPVGSFNTNLSRTQTY